jgi:hypothetical protein
MMAGMIPLILTGLFRVLRTRRALVLENLALRHQLAVLQRTAPRPRRRRSPGRLPYAPGGVRPSGLRGGGPATRRAPVGRSARFASVFFRLASETPHGTRGSTRGVPSEPRPTAAAGVTVKNSISLSRLNFPHHLRR